MHFFLHEFVTAGGHGPSPPPSLRAEGAAMLAAAIEDFRRLPGATVTALIAHDVPGEWGPGCRRIQPSQEEAAFCAEAARADATLVIAPECGGLLERRSRQVLEQGGQLLGCLPEAVRLTADKWQLARWWQNRDVPTPTGYLAPGDDTGGANPPSWCTYPLVCKPRHGAGSQATYLIAHAGALLPALRAAQADMPGDDLLVQAFVPGRAASVAFLVGPQQTLALAPGWQLLSNDGRFRYQGGRLPLPPPWNERALSLASRAIAGIAGLQGFVGVDLVLGDDGRDYAIEINPRLTTSYLGLRRLAQDNLAECWLRLLTGATHQEVTWQEGSIAFAVPL